MRAIALGVLLLAGCDFEATQRCADGYVCPSHLECVTPATYQHCALPANITQCAGAADYSACNYFNNSGAGFEGACRGGVCVRCTNDLEGCNIGAWTVMTNVGEDLTSVWVAARGDAYATGSGGTIFHYDGLGWSSLVKLGAPLVSIGPGLVVLDQTGATFQMTVGADMPPIVTQITAPAGMKAVGGAPMRVYGVGVGFIDMLGNGWMNEITDASKAFDSVSVAASGQVFAAGNAGAIEVFDGSAWNVAPVMTTHKLTSVWAADGQDAFAVGTVATTQSYATIVQLDRGTWSANQTEVPSVNLYAVWGSALDDVYAAGESGNLYHFTSTWNQVPALTTETINALGGSGPDDVFAVGNGGTILHLSN